MINKFIRLLISPIQMDQEALEIINTLEQYRDELNLKIQNKSILDWNKLNFARFLSSNTLGKNNEARRLWQMANLELNSWIENQTVIDFSHITRVNTIVTKNHNNLRTIKIYAADKEFINSKYFEKAQEYINQLLMRNDISPLEKAFRVYQAIVSCHFFYDANGRTARLISDFILLNNSYLPTSYPSSVSSHVAIDINSETNDIQLFYKNYLLALKNSYLLVD